MSKITNICVYGIGESFKASKYPMSVNTELCNYDFTEKIKLLAGCKMGTGHDNFLNGIVVQFDLTFPIKAWVEAQRYHFLDFVSSQSTMHKISFMDIRESCNSYVDERIICVVDELKQIYNETGLEEDYLKLLYNIPTGFELTARMTTNYRQLKTIYRQRLGHKLPDWRVFLDWIETLPFSELITGEE